MRNFAPGTHRLYVFVQLCNNKYYYMRNKFLSCFLLLLGMISLVSTANAADIASGTISSKSGTYVTTTPPAGASSVSTTTTSAASISWVIDENGVLTISPSTYATVKVDKVDTKVCPMPDFSTTAVAPWYEYRTKIKRVVIKVVLLL